MTTNATKPAVIDQRAELIAAQRQVWGDAVQMCASKGCEHEVAPRSCYCAACEDEIYGVRVPAALLQRVADVVYGAAGDDAYADEKKADAQALYTLINR